MFRNEKTAAILEIITVGLPFCTFKLLAGVLLGRWGVPFFALCALDLVCNLGNLVSVPLVGRRVFPVCTVNLLLQCLGRRGQAWQEMASAVDLFLSFAIVAIVIGAGFLKRFSPVEMCAWNVAVIANVLGAGLFQINQAFGNLKS